MKVSILFEQHKSLDAEFGTYYHWQRPKFFSDIADEYSAAKEAVTLMERPYFGLLKVSGKDHVDLLHRMTTNELRNLKPGEGQINIFTDEKGRIVDRCSLQKFADAIGLITSPGRSEKIASWIEKYTFLEDVTVEDRASRLGILSVFGPRGVDVLDALFADNPQMPLYHHKQMVWDKFAVRVYRTGELAVPTFDLIADWESLPALWEALMEKGSEFGLKPMGEESYEVLRIENGWPVSGKDFDESRNPHEAQMGPYLNFDKGCYIGQEVIARLDTYEKVQKYLTGIMLESNAMPRTRDAVRIAGQEAGFLTSVIHSPGLKKNIALAYVRTNFIREGVEVLIESGEHKISGKLLKLPFVTAAQG